MKAVAVITALCLIGAIILLIKGLRDAKEIDDDNELLTQGEIDAFRMSAEDKHLSDLIDQWGRKKFGKTEDKSVNKREFTNRSDEDVDLNFLNGLN